MIVIDDKNSFHFANCDECGKSCERVVIFDYRPQSDNGNTRICMSCLTLAIELLDNPKYK